MSQDTAARATSDRQQLLRVLLWYRKGAGIHFSGPGRTAYRMYSQSASGRFHVTLVHGLPDHDHYDLFKEQIYVGECGTGIPSQLKFIYRGKRWLSQHAKSYDVFHGLSGYRVTLSPALHAQQLGVPAVVKLIAWRADMSDKQRWKTWFGVNRRRRDQLRQLDGVIAIAPAIVDELAEYGVPPQRIACIPNGVDVQHYQPCADQQEKDALREQLGLSHLPIVLFAGGVNQRKQPQILIDAMGRLKQRAVECQLVIAGPLDDLALADRMKRRAQELQLGDSVTWLGVCQDMAPIYRAADIFCLPSQLEGMPNAVLEAMASGMPSIVTRIPGSIDLVDDGQSGIHADAGADEFAEAIETYLNAPRLMRQHGIAARNKAVDHFDVVRVLDAHERLFRAIRSGHEAASASLF